MHSVINWQEVHLELTMIAKRAISNLVEVRYEFGWDFAKQSIKLCGIVCHTFELELTG
jgi:hypothetical protein